MSTPFRLDRLVGREVHAGKRRVGRLQEVRAVRRGDSWIVTDYLIGTTGLTERLGLGVRLILGLKVAGGYVAHWDQLDLSDPDHPRLICAIEELRRE